MRRDLLASGPYCGPREALLATLAAVFSAGCGGTVLTRPMLKVNRTRPAVWLRPGPQSKVGSRLRSLARRLKDKDPWITLRKIHRWIKANTRKYRGVKASVLGKRTAAELLQSRALSGCNDWGLLFATLARACGLPTVFVKGIHKGWARRWVEGDAGPRMGHVFLEVYIQSKWILVDSVRGFYWTRYNPEDPNLPLGYYAYAKARDPGEMRLTSIYVLNRSLENIAEYLEGKQLRAPHYPRGFLIPTVALLAPRSVFQYLKNAFPQIRFRRRTIAGLRRQPEKTAGLDVLILVLKNKLRRTLHLAADPLGMDGAQANALAADGPAARMTYTGKRPVCVAAADSAEALKAVGRQLLQVTPSRESALRTDRCQVPKAPPRAAPPARKPIAERFHQATPRPFRNMAPAPPM